MSCKKIAIVRMEEGYMRLTIEYDDPTYKSKICTNIVELENKLKIHPEVIYRKGNDKKSFCSVEFSGDEYICSRTCGDFIEKLLQNLNIERCESD
jgi:hypothetical protein